MKNIPSPIPILTAELTERASQTPPDNIVERRAEEIAVILDHPAVTDEDRRQALAELKGQTVPATLEDDADTTDSLSRDPSDPAANHGHQIQTLEGTDEEHVRETLVNEGVEEAQHDQMLASRQRKAD